MTARLPRIVLLPATVSATLLAVVLVPAGDLRADDKSWATAGKILTGVVAVDILANHLPNRQERHPQCQSGGYMVAPQPVFVGPGYYGTAEAYGGPAAKYREFAPPPPPLPDQGQPQTAPAPGQAQQSPPQQSQLPPKSVRIGADGNCSLEGKTVAPSGLQSLLTGVPLETPVSVLAARTLPFQQVVTVLDTLRGLGYQNLSLLADTPAQPEAPPPAPPQPPAGKTIAITADGMCQMDGKTIAPEKLKNALAGADPATPLIIEAAPDAPYQKVISVLDTLKGLGFQKLNLKPVQDPVK
jgi:biopolymer transport protein ExbD